MYPLSAGIVVNTKAIWDQLVPALQDLSVRLVFELSELPDDAIAFSERLDRVRPDVIFLDVAMLREPLEDVVRRIRATANQPAVFALHTAAESDAILTALRAGVSEYLFLPVDKQHLQAALERLSQSRQQAREGTRLGGKTVAFISAKGGCGATTLAWHVAADLPNMIPGRVLLADLDLQTGMIGFLAKAKSTYSIADAVSNVQRLDASYWRALVSNGIPRMEIISAPTVPTSKQLAPAHLKQVLAFARTQYDWTVADLGRNLNTQSLSMLDLIDETYLVTTHDIPSLHQAKQMIQFLLDGGYPRSNLRLVLNRVPKRLDVTLEELEKMLGINIYATILNDYPAMQEAYAEGRMVEAASALGKSFSRLTAKITGTEPKKKTGFSFFS